MRGIIAAALTLWLLGAGCTVAITDAKQHGTTISSQSVSGLALDEPEPGNGRDHGMYIENVEGITDATCDYVGKSKVELQFRSEDDLSIVSVNYVLIDGVDGARIHDWPEFFSNLRAGEKVHLVTDAAFSPPSQLDQDQIECEIRQIEGGLDLGTSVEPSGTDACAVTFHSTGRDGMIEVNLEGTNPFGEVGRATAEYAIEAPGFVRVGQGNGGVSDPLPNEKFRDKQFISNSLPPDIDPSDVECTILKFWTRG